MRIMPNMQQQYDVQAAADRLIEMMPAGLASDARRIRETLPIDQRPTSISWR